MVSCHVFRYVEKLNNHGAAQDQYQPQLANSYGSSNNDSYGSSRNDSYGGRNDQGNDY